MFISYSQLTGFVEIWPTGCSVALERSKFLTFLLKITFTKDLLRMPYVQDFKVISKISDIQKLSGQAVGLISTNPASWGWEMRKT